LIESSVNEAMTTEDAAEPGSRGNQLTVLVVEDERLVRDLVQELLRAAGYRVVTAADASAAEEGAAREPAIDAFIVDAFVPGGGGVALARRLREHHPDAAVLIVSGFDEGEAADLGDAHFLGKPFSGADLDAALREALASARDRSRR
jgi:DNA-binding response OmpR family regulator